MSQVWIFWESTRQWTMGLEWFQNPVWLSEGVHISHLGKNGPMPIYVYGLVFGLTGSEWALPLLTTGLYGMNALWLYQWMRNTYGQEIAALTSLALVSNPILWQLARSGIEFSFAIVLAPYLGYLLVASKPSSRLVTWSDIGFGLLLVAILQFEKTFAPVVPFVTIAYAVRRRRLSSLLPVLVWAAIFLLPPLLHSRIPNQLDYTWDLAMLGRILILYAAQFDVLDSATPWVPAIIAHFLAGVFSLSLFRVAAKGSTLPRTMLMAAFTNIVALSYSPESNHHVLVYMTSAIVLLHGLAVIGLAQSPRYPHIVLSLVCIGQLAIIGESSWTSFHTGTVRVTNWYPLKSPPTIEVPTVRFRQQQIRAANFRPVSAAPINLLIDETGWLSLDTGELQASSVGLVPDITWDAIRGQSITTMPDSTTSSADTTASASRALDPHGKFRAYMSVQKEMYGSMKVMGLAIVPYKTTLFPQTINADGARYFVVRQANFPLEFYDHIAPRLILQGIGDPVATINGYLSRETWYPIQGPQIRVELRVSEDTASYYLGLLWLESAPINP